jgi:hypothetical protein
MMMYLIDVVRVALIPQFFLFISSFFVPYLSFGLWSGRSSVVLKFSGLGTHETNPAAWMALGRVFGLRTIVDGSDPIHILGMR